MSYNVPATSGAAAGVSAGKKELKSVAVNVTNLVGLFRGANAFFPEGGEPDGPEPGLQEPNGGEGFTTALWRQSGETTTADCRGLLTATPARAVPVRSGVSGFSASRRIRSC
jgi:hypothetical protein